MAFFGFFLVVGILFLLFKDTNLPFLVFFKAGYLKDLNLQLEVPDNCFIALRI